MDEFTLDLTEGDPVRVFLNALGFDPTNRITLNLLDPMGRNMLGITSGGGGSGVTSVSDYVHQSGRHTVRIYGNDEQFDGGPYEFAVLRAP